jgi:hypothetical protein
MINCPRRHAPGDLVAIVPRDGMITGIVTVTRLHQVVAREAPRAPQV